MKKSIMFLLLIFTIGCNEKEEEKDDVIERYELSYNTKKLNELLDEVIIIMNKIKSLN